MTKSEDVLTLKYVPLKTVAGWGNNTKRHDIKTIIKSIEQHGFKDPLKYEPALNKGAGGIVEGNGRDEALKIMFAQSPKKPPRGIPIQDKDWLVPVLFGVDAKSQDAAESYGYDHNITTMLGGGFDLQDMMKVYTDDAASMLKSLQQANALPVSVNAEDLDALLDADEEKLSEREETLREKSMLRVLVSIPVNLAMEAQPLIDQLKEIIGVEVDVSGND